MRTDGWTDRHDKANRLFFFRRFANASKKLKFVTLQAMKAYGVRVGTGRYLQSFQSSVAGVSVWLQDSFALLLDKETPIRSGERVG